MTFLHRYCTFQRNEPCSLPAIVEMIAAFMNKKPEDVALATSFNALKLFGLSKWGYRNFTIWRHRFQLLLELKIYL